VELVEALRAAHPARLPVAEPVELSAGEIPRLAKAAPRLVQQAIAHAQAGTHGGRHNTGVWLACQLRDRRIPPEAVEACMLAYQQAVEWLEVPHA
jgi:hypothetical protein